MVRPMVSEDAAVVVEDAGLNKRRLGRARKEGKLVVRSVARDQRADAGGMRRQLQGKAMDTSLPPIVRRTRTGAAVVRGTEERDDEQRSAREWYVLGPAPTRPRSSLGRSASGVSMGRVSMVVTASAGKALIHRSSRTGASTHRWGTRCTDPTGPRRGHAVSAAVTSAPSIGIRIFMASARSSPVGRAGTDIPFPAPGPRHLGGAEERPDVGDDADLWENN